MATYLTAFDSGLLLLRMVLGLSMAAHGCNKFFGSGGLGGTAGWFDSIGMRPGMFHARVAATTEIAAGIGLAAGFLTALSAAGFVALMLVAAWTVHRTNGFFIVKDGWEYSFVLAASAVALSALGSGQLSLDYLLLRTTVLYDYLHGWWGLLVCCVVGLTGGIGQLVLFWRPPNVSA